MGGNIKRLKQETYRQDIQQIKGNIYTLTGRVVVNEVPNSESSSPSLKIVLKMSIQSLILKKSWPRTVFSNEH